MAYERDDRYGGDYRWRERDERSSLDRGRDYGRRDYGRDYGRGDDRGFFERAGDELRSWFGDEEAARRREADERRWERERRMTGYRDNDYGRGGTYGWMSGGWGNQAGESWNRDRPGVRDEREGWFSASRGGERGERWGGSDRDYGGGPAQGDLFGRDRAGGTSGFGGYGSSAHYAAMDRGGGRYGGEYDPHYSEWRRRQIDELDRDYDEYRREHQSRFEHEFRSWREKRQGQRRLLDNVAEHMEVIGSDGSHVGTVDKVRGDRIILTGSDQAAGGIHHSIPCGWVESVDQKVTLNKTADEAMGEWREEERNRALFEREDSGSEGPHMLNRSFAGTYEDRDR